MVGGEKDGIPAVDGQHCRVRPSLVNGAPVSPVGGPARVNRLGRAIFMPCGPG